MARLRVGEKALGVVGVLAKGVGRRALYGVDLLVTTHLLQSHAHRLRQVEGAHAPQCCLLVSFLDGGGGGGEGGVGGGGEGGGEVGEVDCPAEVMISWMVREEEARDKREWEEERREMCSVLMRSVEITSNQNLSRERMESQVVSWMVREEEASEEWEEER